MKLILHIVGKDFLHLRWQWAVWLAVIASKYLIGCGVIWGGPVTNETARWLEVVLSALRAAELVTTFFFTALLVQGDSVVGSRQFWLTRPISGARLLGAKILGALLLLVTPVLALGLPWWWFCGFEGGLVLAAMAEAVAWQVLAVAPAFLVASLTNTLGRFVVWSVVLFWAAMLAPFYVQWELTRWRVLMGMGNVEAAMTERLQAIGIGVAVVAGIVIVLQFLVRRWVRSVVVLVGGSAAVLGWGVLLGGWGLARGGAKTGQPEWNAARADGVKFELVAATADKAEGRPLDERISVGGRLRVIGVPDGVWLTAVDAEFAWKWPDGKVVTAEGWAYGSPRRDREIRRTLGVGEARTDLETERWLRENWKPTRQPEPDPLPPADVNVWVRVPAGAVLRMQREPPQLTLKLKCLLLESRVATTGALSAGGWVAGAGRGRRIYTVGPAVSEGSGTRYQTSVVRHLTLVESYPKLEFENFEQFRRWFPATEIMRRPYWWWYDRVLLANPRHGMGMLNHRRWSSVQISSVALVTQAWTAGVRKVIRDGKWVLEHPDWFDDAKLVAVDDVVVARFTREVAVDEFRLLPR